MNHSIKFVGTNHSVECYESDNGSCRIQLLIPEFINCNINFKNEQK